VPRGVYEHHRRSGLVYKTPTKMKGRANLQPCSVREMSDVEAAWVGAIIEGEGCVYYHKNHEADAGRWRLTVANTDLEIISALLRLTGVGHVTRQTKGTQKDVWYWSVNRVNDVAAIAAQCQLFCWKLRKVKV